MGLSKHFNLQEGVMTNNTKDWLLIESDTNDNLIINFSQYFGYECIATITSWDKGISWSGVTESEDQTIEALSEMGVPFVAICSSEEAARWLATFPYGLQDRLIEFESKYRGTLYALLWCISRSKHAEELFEHSPLLVWVLLKTAQLRQWDADYVLSLFSCKRTEILSVCGLGESKSILKLFLKLKLNYFSQYEFDLITSYDWRSLSNYLNHLPFIDDRLLKLLQRYPEFITSKLIQKFGNQWNWKDFNMIFDDTLEMAAELGIRDIVTHASLCKDHNQLSNLHNKLVADINEQKSKATLLIEYNEPPIEGTSYIIPITNNHELFKEGKEQYHCIASYHARIFKGEYFAYKVLEPERATLGLRIIKGSGYSIDQIYMKFNGAVSADTRAAVSDWLNNAVIMDHKVKHAF